MKLIAAALFILFIAIMSVPIALRLGLPLEVFLVIGSAIVSMVPGLPNFEIDPMIIFGLFLPPILFAGGYFTSWSEFKFNIRPILLLAVGLVLLTTVVVAVVAKYCLPGFTWAEGFLLGAIISPSDAAAATAIIKKLGAPRRFVAVLEGESLINDATALTLYRFSLAAIVLGSFSFADAAMQFAWVAVGGLTIGLVVGIVTVYLVKIVKDAQATTTLTFITAFFCYLAAENLGVSGVIATVTCGIYFGVNLHDSTSSQARINAKASWNTMLFIINGFVFTLLGLELPYILKNLGSYTVAELVGYGLLVSFVVIALRIVWIFPSAYLPRKLIPMIGRKDPLPPWQFLLALGWTGMRGIISLAAALSIPYHISPGVPFPHRDLFIFLTYCVIIATLILPALTLPNLFRFLHLTESEDKIKEEAFARIRAMEGVCETIASFAKDEKIPQKILEEFRHQLDRKLKVIQTQVAENPFSSLNMDYMAYKKLTLIALKNERETLYRLRRTNEIHEDVFHILADELDVEEIRANTLRL